MSGRFRESPADFLRADRLARGIDKPKKEKPEIPRKRMLLDVLAESEIETAAMLWWKSDGVYIDPDTEDLDWYDKRKELAQMAFIAGYNKAMSTMARNVL